jgi:acetyltransferase-like isoleucine patch superfamily enzyme
VEDQFGGEVGSVELGDFVTVGAHSCILPNVNLPKGFACGAHSLIKEGNFDEWSLYAGVPVKKIKKRDTTKILSWSPKK